MQEKKENKKGYYFWLEPSVGEQINTHLYSADKKSRSEFVNEAVKKYCCELDSEENKAYLSRELINVIQANIKSAERHIASTIFKLAGEQATLNLLIADHIINITDEETARVYRNQGYDIVRKRKGVFTFDDAMKDAKAVSQEE